MPNRLTNGPAELADAVTRNWKDTEGLPTTESVRDIIAESYRLSFEADERRYPKLLLASLGTKTLPEPSVPLGERPRFLKDIVAVAPAIAPPPFALVLSSGEVTRCRSIINLARAQNWPGIYFGIRGPGEIEVETYRHQTRRSWVLFRGLCEPIKKLEESRIFTDLCHNSARHTQSSKTLVGKLLSDLVYTISRRGHGGALIFTDHDFPTMDSSPEIDFGNKPFPLLPPKLTHLQMNLIISCLTQIDGAVLLDSRFRVRGAGLFLEQKKVDILQLTADGPGMKIDYRRLGSRHRSAAWFCRQTKGAVAIVISKDQIIRVFGNCDSKVVVEGPYLDSIISIAMSGQRLSP